MVIYVIGSHRYGIAALPAPVEPANYNNIANLGRVLYTHYAYPFEIAAILLLTGIVAAISLTHQPGKRHKSQRVSAQIAVKPSDRLRLVDMPSEPRQQPLPKETGP
jgi:NADH-quinone oxidoreductase subunit J